MQRRILVVSLVIFLIVGIFILIEGIFYYYLGIQYGFPYWIENSLLIISILGIIIQVVIAFNVYLLRRFSNP